MPSARQPIVLEGKEMQASQEILLRCHRKLDVALRVERDRCFISGWQVENPWASHYVDLEDILKEARGSVGTYQFLSDQHDLAQAIGDFHRGADGLQLREEQIFVAPGSSPLIMAIMAALADRGVRRIYYLPPVYYVFFYWARLLGIELVPLTAEWVALQDMDLPLPDEKAVLLVSDPAWVVGRYVSRDMIERIAAWQSRTGSLVVVDGTFQYTKWNQSGAGEFSSFLPPSQTLRLVCPTKAIGVNGVRFSYVLTPADFREDVRYAASNGSGASDSFNVAAARRTMEVLNSRDGNRLFVEHIKRRAQELEDKIYRKPHARPNCTYYIFSDLLVERDRCLAMDAPFFEGPDHTGVRVNLLLPGHELEKLSQLGSGST